MPEARRCAARRHEKGRAQRQREAGLQDLGRGVLLATACAQAPPPRPSPVKGEGEVKATRRRPLKFPLPPCGGGSGCVTATAPSYSVHPPVLFLPWRGTT